jgi:DNA repair exonuclease SbcCD ATPase subunit
MTDMLVHDVDVAAFIMQEGTALMDSETEKSVISYVRSLMLSVEGEIPESDQCIIQNRCLYRRVYDAFEAYFHSYQSKQKGKFSKYDWEQFEHAFKNVQSIKRLVNFDVPETLGSVFDIKNMMKRLCDGKSGCDIDYIKYLIEETAKSEQRSQYIQQRQECVQRLEIMKSSVLIDVDEDATNAIKTKIDAAIEKRDRCNTDISDITSRLEITDRNRMLISGIQRVDINALEKRRLQLEKSVNELQGAMQEYTAFSEAYQLKRASADTLTRDLDQLEKAVDQYTKTTADIESHQTADATYKAIAEATSSTKGMPVIAIRDTVDRAIATANRLLNVMYEDEIQLLRPIIDETRFQLPFKCGNNRSEDIRYGSQSESTLLSLALSLSLAASLTHYSVPLIDEIDAYLDIAIRDGFILMLDSMMNAMGMQQMFLISHNLQKGQFEHIVHTVDISEIITERS